MNESEEKQREFYEKRRKQNERSEELTKRRQAKIESNASRVSPAIVGAEISKEIAQSGEYEKWYNDDILMKLKDEIFPVQTTFRKALSEALTNENGRNLCYNNFRQKFQVKYPEVEENLFGVIVLKMWNQEKGSKFGDFIKGLNHPLIYKKCIASRWRETVSSHF